jgi:hypothetical protein
MKIVYKLNLLLTLTLLLSFSMTGSSFAQQEHTVITNSDNYITIYPTPANTRVNIRLSTGLRSDVEKVEIVNLIGRKLKEQVLIDKNTTEVSFTDISDLAQGIYMVIARDKFGKIIQSAKMVVNR